MASETAGNSDSIVAAAQPKAAPTKAAAYGEIADNTDKIKRSAEELRANRKDNADLKVPEAPKLTDAPEFKDVSPLEAFGSLATAFGLLASLKTRQPLTSGLNAAGDAMRSIKEGNIQNYKLKMEEWKAHTDQALKQFDVENKQFGNIVAKKNLTQNELIAELKAWAVANNNLVALQHLRQGDAHIALEGARLAESARARTQAHADAVMARNTQLRIHLDESALARTKTLLEFGVPVDKVNDINMNVEKGMPLGAAIKESGAEIHGNNKERNAAFLHMLTTISPSDHAAAGRIFSENPNATPEELMVKLSELKPKTSVTQEAKDIDRQRAVGTALTDLQILDKTLQSAANQGESVTGFGGSISRGKAAIGAALGQDWGGETASRVQQQITSLQSRLKDLINVPNSRISADVRANADKILSGLGKFSTLDEARQSIKDLSRTMLQINGPPLDAPNDVELRYFANDPKDPSKGGAYHWGKVNTSTNKFDTWEYD